jgi:hypothetical protein
MRGIGVHMEMNLGEQYAEHFCCTLGLRAERFTKEELRRGKTPDFRVFDSGNLVFYCEAKHIQHDDWLDERLAAAKTGEIAGGLRGDPIFNRLAEHVHRSSKQFAAVNADRKHPNVLVLVNSDRQCGFPDLLAVLTGNFYAESGEVAPIYKNYSEGRIREEKKTVDLYIWFNEWKGRDQKGSHFFIDNGPHYQNLCSLTGSDPLLHRRR